MIKQRDAYRLQMAWWRSAAKGYSGYTRNFIISERGVRWLEAELLYCLMGFNPGACAAAKVAKDRRRVDVLAAHAAISENVQAFCGVSVRRELSRVRLASYRNYGSVDRLPLDRAAS